MANNKTLSGGQDRTRFNVHEDYEPRDWSKKFEVTPEALQEAVEIVGPTVAAVEKHFAENDRQAVTSAP